MEVKERILNLLDEKNGKTVKEIREIADEIGAYIHFDGAHVAGLIAGGKFQDPLREGADVFTISTHKTLPGPQGGAVFSHSKYCLLYTSPSPRD